MNHLTNRSLFIVKRQLLYILVQQLALPNFRKENIYLTVLPDTITQER